MLVKLYACKVAYARKISKKNYYTEEYGEARGETAKCAVIRGGLPSGWEQGSSHVLFHCITGAYYPKIRKVKQPDLHLRKSI